MERSVIYSVINQIESVVRDSQCEGEDSQSGLKYSFLRESHSSDSWQWFWETCFQTIVLSHLSPEIAISGLRTLISTQEPDGFIGRVKFWGERSTAGLIRRVPRPDLWSLRSSRLIHPPMLPQALAKTVDSTGDAWLSVELLPALDRYYNWLADNRVPDPDGLLVIISPHESGMAPSPSFDEVFNANGQNNGIKRSILERWTEIRNIVADNDQNIATSFSPFRVKEVMVNSLYADGLATMANLHRRNGHIEAANAYATRAEVVTASLVEKLWDRSRGAFFSLYGEDEQRTIPLTIASLAPLILESLPRENAVALIERHLSEHNQFWTSYPVPTVAATEDSFTPRGDQMGWRGPSSVAANWIIWLGLNRHGYHDLAQRLAARSLDMVARSGLRSFYHPHTGQGLGANGVASSGLVLDMIPS